MEFLFNAQQSMLADSVRGRFAQAYPAEVIRRFVEAKVYEPLGLAALTELGVLGVCAAPEAGGSGLGLVDALPILFACGRHLVPFPVTESIVAAAMLSRTNPALVKRLTAGEEMASVSVATGLHAIGTDRPVLSGCLPSVPWAACCRWLLVTGSNEDAGEEDRLMLVDLTAPGATLGPAESLDLTYPSSRVVLDGASAQAVPLPHGADEFRMCYAVGVAAEMSGTAEACLEKVVAYMGQRRQFGQPIGAFQALKHMAADDAVRVEGMHLAVQYAAASFDVGQLDRELAVAVAASYAADAARQVAENSMQGHGAIAYTWEFDLHLYYRRILRCAVIAGTAAEHREILAAALLDNDASAHPAKAI